MPLRLIIIPAFLMVAALLGGLASLGLNFTPQSGQTAFEKMMAVESNSKDLQFRWSKALELTDAEAKVIEAQNKALASSIRLYRWSLFIVIILMVSQMWLTFEWWKKASNTSINEDAPNRRAC